MSLKLFNARLAQSVERQPFKLVVVGSSPTSGEGKRQSLGLEPEVSVEMEGHYPKKKVSHILKRDKGRRGLKKRVGKNVEMEKYNTSCNGTDYVTKLNL